MTSLLFNTVLSVMCGTLAIFIGNKLLKSYYFTDKLWTSGIIIGGILMFLGIITNALAMLFMVFKANKFMVIHPVNIAIVFIAITMEIISYILYCVAYVYHPQSSIKTIKTVDEYIDKLQKPHKCMQASHIVAFCTMFIMLTHIILTLVTAAA